MQVSVIREAGFDEAMLGLSLSYNTLDVVSARKTAKILCSKDGGHNKFLESISVWLDITAPRYWWQQFDTYRIGVTKQSESTMHTILKNRLSYANFERGADGITNQHLDHLNDCIEAKEFEYVKRILPESFLQRRIVCTNYKALRNMIRQRYSHRLEEWKLFSYIMLIQLQYADFLGLEDNIINELDSYNKR